MKVIVVLFAMLFATLGFSQTTFDIQYQLSGVWLGAGGQSAFIAQAHGAAASTGSDSESLQFRFVCYYPSADSLDVPVGHGVATVNIDEESDTAALIIGSTGSASATATCGETTCHSSKSSGGTDPESDGPVLLTGIGAVGSALSWTYDASNARWVGTESLLTISISLSASYTPAGSGDSRDQSSAKGTISPGSMGLITSNSITVTQ